MATAMNLSGELRGWLVKFASLVLGYWLLLLLASLPFIQPPPFFESLLIASALPVLVGGAIAIWRRSLRAIDTLPLKDDLTGLANRGAFRDKAASMLDDAAPGTVAIVMLDVDGLKRLNDGCGLE